MARTATRRRGLTRLGHIGPNMTPMVDVVLCILIFFMLGSSFLRPELFLQSQMPAIEKGGLGDEANKQKLPAVRLNILLKHEGDATWISAFNSQLIRMDASDERGISGNAGLLQMLKQKRKQLSDDVQIIIVPEKAVRYQDVITVYDFCMAAQFKQVAFAPAR